ncbi:MAG TPA: hypothetical protein VGB77_12810 [Abditibacteriaceae bacterium]|jgi:hypothetical protein
MIQLYYTPENHERFRSVWQGYGGAPQSLNNWRNQMRAYVKRRWYDSDHVCAATHECARGFDAFDPALVPLALIINTKRADITFDLTDPLTYSVWMDYLNEYADRAELWAEFEAAHGVQEKLA